MKKSFIIVALLFITVQLQAKQFIESVGTETGNGGGVVVCRSADGTIQKAELLDFYEARVLRNLTLDLGDANLDFNKKIENVLTKLSKVSPIRAQKYRNIYSKFFKEAVIIPDAEL